MLPKYTWLNYTDCHREKVDLGEVVFLHKRIPILRGVVTVEQDNSLFISFAFTKEFSVKQLMSLVYTFKSKYGHLKWVANVHKDSLICRNFAKRFGFVEKSDILLEDSNLILIEREPD